MKRHFVSNCRSNNIRDDVRVDYDFWLECATTQRQWIECDRELNIARGNVK